MGMLWFRESLEKEETGGRRKRGSGMGITENFIPDDATTSAGALALLEVSCLCSLGLLCLGVW